MVAAGLHYFLKDLWESLFLGSFRLCGVGRIQFLVVVELRSSFPSWLSAEDHMQLLEATFIPWFMDPFLHL